MWWDGLFSSDDPNRQAIERFLAQLALALLLAHLVEGSERLAIFWILMLISAAANVIAALVKGEAFEAPRLNHWDEALGFAALMLLAGAFMPAPEPTGVASLPQPAGTAVPAP